MMSLGTNDIEWNENQTKHYSEELRGLLERCLPFDPNERPDFPEVLKKIREYRLTFQHGLRDEPADGRAWEDHLLTPETTNLVRVRRIRSSSWDVLTTLQGFAMETVANCSTEGAFDSPIKIGGKTGTQLLKDQVKVPKSVEHAVPESDGDVVSPSGSGEEAPRPPPSGAQNLFRPPPPMGGGFGAPPGGGGIKWFGASGASTRPNT